MAVIELFKKRVPCISCCVYYRRSPQLRHALGEGTGLECCNGSERPQVQSHTTRWKSHPKHGDCPCCLTGFKKGVVQVLLQTHYREVNSVYSRLSFIQTPKSHGFWLSYRKSELPEIHLNIMQAEIVICYIDGYAHKADIWLSPLHGPTKHKRLCHTWNIDEMYDTSLFIPQLSCPLGTL